MDKNLTSGNEVLDWPIKQGESSQSPDTENFSDFGKVIEGELHYFLDEFLNSKSVVQNRQKKSAYQSPKIRKTELKAEIELFDEPFFIMKKEGEIHLKHKIWSLSGFGETAVDAIDNLKENGKILLSVYSDYKKKELDKDAQEMVEFLMLTFGNG